MKKKNLFFFLFSRPFFGSKTSQSEENSTQSSSPENHHPIQPNISKQSSHDSENHPLLSPSLLQEVGNEMNSTVAGRAVSNIAKKATNKISELLSIY